MQVETALDSKERHQSLERSVQLWSKCKARKSGVCDASGERYRPGAEIYRPVGNSRNRSMRILAVHIDNSDTKETNGSGLPSRPGAGER